MLARALDKTGSLGALVAAMSCAGCFPALGSFGAAIGMGFLGHYEGFLFRRLIPALAVLVLCAHLWAWSRHRHAVRGLLSIAGPLWVLAALWVFWSTPWGVELFYVGVAWMLAVSILDVLRPAQTVCHPLQR